MKYRAKCAKMNYLYVCNLGKGKKISFEFEAVLVLSGASLEFGPPRSNSAI